MLMTRLLLLPLLEDPLYSKANVSIATMKFEVQYTTHSLIYDGVVVAAGHGGGICLYCTEPDLSCHVSVSVKMQNKHDLFLVCVCVSHFLTGTVLVLYSTKLQHIPGISTPTSLFGLFTFIFLFSFRYLSSLSLSI